MDQTSQAIITIRRPDDWVGSSRRSFVVRIDGRRVGKVKPGSVGEFAVEPGTRTVTVSMDWVKSLPRQVTAAPGSRTELVIRGRPEKVGWRRMFVPIIVAVLAAQLVTGLLLEPLGLAGAGWWTRTGIFLAVYFAAVAAFVLAASFFAPDYWAMWTLEPVA